jgi:hypothetical protein
LLAFWKEGKGKMNRLADTHRPLKDRLPGFFKGFFRISIVLVTANEIRGILMSLPVLYGMYEAGGTGMAIWLGCCTIFGVALSVILPLGIIKRLQRYLARRAEGKLSQEKSKANTYKVL